MSTVYDYELEQQINDILGDVPCDCCVVRGHNPINAATRGVRWECPGCIKHGVTFLLCETCPTRGMSGPCDCCGIIGHYEVLL